jgi:hypothetical protein
VEKPPEKIPLPAPTNQRLARQKSVRVAPKNADYA